MDDAEDDRQFFTDSIQQAGRTLSTTVARYGEEALACPQAAKQSGRLTALVLMDINMPRMNGKEAIACIKSDPALRTIPVVVLTTSRLSADRLFCAPHGVEMVSKPPSCDPM